jgi:hypothetical protein
LRLDSLFSSLLPMLRSLLSLLLLLLEAFNDRREGLSPFLLLLRDREPELPSDDTSLLLLLERLRELELPAGACSARSSVVMESWYLQSPPAGSPLKAMDAVSCLSVAERLVVFIVATEESVLAVLVVVVVATVPSSSLRDLRLFSVRPKVKSKEGIELGLDL